MLTINESYFTINEKCTNTLAKSVLMPLRLTTAVSVTSPAIQKKIYGSGWLHWHRDD